MKKTFIALLLAGSLYSCTQHDKALVSAQLIDSLICHYTPSSLCVQNEQERQFWKGRINPASPGYLNESRYAGALGMAFRLSGAIDSLEKADSVLLLVDRTFHHKETSADLSLVNHCISRHRFAQADSFFQKAVQLGLRPYESLSTAFDVDFELGRYAKAAIELGGLRSGGDFGYYFRKSKMDHLKGNLDQSIADMNMAAEQVGTNIFLKDVALANAGDLYVHAEELDEARDAYVAAIRLNSDDVHSLIGLGWIALVHDQNDALAGKIFRWVGSKSPAPDPLFRLSQLEGARGDTAMQGQYARAYATAVTQPVYGRMYHKYLIQLYTGALHNPQAAEVMAADELNNRATPQTYAWYAWALFANGKKDQAYQVYEQHVSGQPLEALELYWMGKMMEGLNKNYNAIAFYKAADKTRYDLDPADAALIKQRLSE